MGSAAQNISNYKYCTVFHTLKKRNIAQWCALFCFGDIIELVWVICSSFWGFVSAGEMPDFPVGIDLFHWDCRRPPPKYYSIYITVIYVCSFFSLISTEWFGVFGLLSMLCIQDFGWSSFFLAILSSSSWRFMNCSRPRSISSVCFGSDLSVQEEFFSKAKLRQPVIFLRAVLVVRDAWPPLLVSKDEPTMRRQSILVVCIHWYNQGCRLPQNSPVCHYYCWCRANSSSPLAFQLAFISNQCHKILYTPWLRAETFPGR